jgi:hypothetical protein
MAGQMLSLVIATACTASRLTTPPVPRASTAAPPVASAVARPKPPLRWTPELGDEVDQPTGDPADPYVEIAGSTVAFICRESVRTWPFDGRDEGALIEFASKPWSHDPCDTPTVVLSPDGAVVATQQEGQSDVVLWSARSGARLVSLARPAQTRKLEAPCSMSYRGFREVIAFSEDSALVATAWDGEPGVVRVWKVETGSIVFTWRTAEPIRHVEFLAQGEMLLVRSGTQEIGSLAMPPEDDSVTILRLRDGRSELHLQPLHALSYAIPTKDGTRLLVIPMDIYATGAKAEVRELPSGRVLHRMELPVENLDFALHGHRLALATTEIEVQVLDLDLGTLGAALARPPSTDAATYGVVAWTPDGGRLLTAPTGTAIRIWDPLTMTLERTLPTPRGPTTVHSLVDGRFVHGWAPWTVVPGANRLLRLSDAVAVSLLVGAPPATQGGIRRCAGIVAADDGSYDGDEDLMAHLRFRADRDDLPSGTSSAAAPSDLRRPGLFADFAAGKSMGAR